MYPARLPHFFAVPFSPPSSLRSANACTNRQIAYAAKPRARTVSSTFPNECCASDCRAPWRLVALPPSPSANLIASTPTIPKETPFAINPIRASQAYQPLPDSALARVSRAGCFAFSAAFCPLLVVAATVTPPRLGRGIQRPPRRTSYAPTATVSAVPPTVQPSPASG